LLWLLLLLLRRSRGVGIPRVGRLTSTGLLRNGLLLLLLRVAPPDGVLRRTRAVPSAAERVVVLVVRVRGHAYRGTLRVVDGGPAGLA
jgi:hypothetical protein